jgi:dipeptidyl aminopeptidase/acylaminoacyl peptidase
MAPVVTPAPAAPLATAHAATPAPTVKLQPPLPAATVTASATASPTASASPTEAATASLTPMPTNTPRPLPPLAIAVERSRAYPGSEITIEQQLDPGVNYQRYIASYFSDGLKIYALLTIPDGDRPETGWPVIVFNHGYIPPQIYQTTERYVAYVDAFARNGYIVFKSDYRGHGNSEGLPTGGYGTPDYTTDVLNAVASLKRLPQADPNRIGMWGHSMGGQVTLRAMVVSKDIKAGVIWGGVVAPYPDLLHWFESRRPTAEPTPSYAGGRHWREEFIAQFGTPLQNPAFWAAISPNSFLADISGPLQLHHGEADEEVPMQMSITLADEMRQAGKYVELYTYPNNEHNIYASFDLAMQRSVAFMDKWVKAR